MTCDFTAAVSLEAARRALDEAATHDPSLQALAARVADYLYGATDAAQDLASYLDRLEADPAQAGRHASAAVNHQRRGAPLWTRGR